MLLKLRCGGTLNYEVYGSQGEWLVFLNGIMMSVPSWKDMTKPVSEHFRLLLVDFRDQGKSSRFSEPYTCDIHVPDLIELFDYLQIERIHMMGVSYGGQVALEFCRNFQDRLKSLSLVTVLPKVTNYLKAMGEGWEIAASLNDGSRFFSLCIPSIYSDIFYENNLEWLLKRQQAFKSTLTEEWFRAFIRLSQSANRFNREDVLPFIRVPTLVLSAERDILTPSRDMKEMAKAIPHSVALEIQGAGHAAFLEKPNAFLTALIGFLKTQA
jgi:pimeloyl-ACP methyl ester carboxylesterase